MTAARAQCPKCLHSVALSPASGVFLRHRGTTGKNGTCPSTGLTPEAATNLEAAPAKRRPPTPQEVIDRTAAAIAAGRSKAQQDLGAFTAKVSDGVAEALTFYIDGAITAQRQLELVDEFQRVWDARQGQLYPGRNDLTPLERLRALHVAALDLQRYYVDSLLSVTPSVGGNAIRLYLETVRHGVTARFANDVLHRFSLPTVIHECLEAMDEGDRELREIR